MQKIEAFKSNSGKLFNTELEAKSEDCKDALIKFMKKDDPEEWYIGRTVLEYGRSAAISEMSGMIVKYKSEFLKIISELP